MSLTTEQQKQIEFAKTYKETTGSFPLAELWVKRNVAFELDNGEEVYFPYARKAITAAFGNYPNFRKACGAPVIKRSANDPDAVSHPNGKTVKIDKLLFQNDNDEIHRECINCHESYPFTKEFFLTDHAPDRLGKECRFCKNCLFCEKPIPARNKYCNAACQNALQAKERVLDFLEGAHDGKNMQFKTGSWIKEFLLNYYDRKCVSCGTGEIWNGEPLVLEVDHSDGDHENNTIGNLTILCRNCHSQTATYGNKNKGNGRAWRMERRAAGKSF
jgi:hypothetical protein